MHILVFSIFLGMIINSLIKHLFHLPTIKHFKLAKVSKKIQFSQNKPFKLLQVYNNKPFSCYKKPLSNKPTLFEI